MPATSRKLDIILLIFMALVLACELLLVTGSTTTLSSAPERLVVGSTGFHDAIDTREVVVGLLGWQGMGAA